MVDVDTYSYRGPVLYDGEKYEKLDVDDLFEEPVSTTTTGGWLASIQHHFLAAAVPPADGPAAYRATFKDGIYTLTAISEVRTVAAGETAVFQETLFIGPKLQEQLKETAPGLRVPDHHLPAAFLGAGKIARTDRQLGVGNHPPHRADQTGLLQVIRDQRQVHGEDAETAAAHQGLAGTFPG
jgi:hypothetical protein